MADDVSVATTGEINRLARLLRVEVGDIAYLRRLDAVEIRALRVAVTTSMHHDNGAVFARIANASKLLPAKATAALAQRGLAAWVSAGVVGEMPPRHAVDLARRMAPAYLADVCQHLIPAAVAPVVSLMPDEVLHSTVAQLVQRRDVDTMADIVNALTDEQVQMVLGDITDPDLLLDIMVRVTDPDDADRLLNLAPEGTLRQVARTAAKNPRLWAQALSLLGRLPAPTRRRVLAGIRQPGPSPRSGR